MHISNKCSIAIHCLIFINEYGAKRKVTSELLSLSSGCNPVTIRNILSALKKAGIIHVRFGTGGASIELPLSEISLYRICMIVEPDFIEKLVGIHTSPSRICPVGRNIYHVLSGTYDTLQKDLISSMEKITLQMMVDDYHRALQSDEKKTGDKQG